MSIARDLLDHFGTDNVLLACKELVEETFPEPSACSGGRDVFALTREAGIRINVEEIDSFDGRIESDSVGQATITLTSLSPKTRTRFTLAHELGHWLLGRGKPATTSFRGIAPGSVADNEEESLANLIAAELLMPVSFVSHELHSAKSLFAAINRIMERCGVSFRAALRRIADVGQFPLIYLSILPTLFQDPTSPARVDDFMVIQPLRRMKNCRDTTRLARPYRYSEISTQRLVKLGVITPDGRFLEEFSVRSRPRPIPNCDLIGIVGGGVRRAAFT